MNIAFRSWRSFRETWQWWAHPPPRITTNTPDNKYTVFHMQCAANALYTAKLWMPLDHIVLAVFLWCRPLLSPQVLPGRLINFPLVSYDAWGVSRPLASASQSLTVILSRSLELQNRCVCVPPILNLAGSDGMRFLLLRVKATLNPIRVSSVSRVRNRARKRAADKGSTDEIWEPSALKSLTLLFIFDSMV